MRWIRRITGSCMAGAFTTSTAITGRSSGWIRKPSGASYFPVRKGGTSASDWADPAGPNTAERRISPLVTAAHRGRIVIDDIGYVHSRAPRHPAPPPPAPRPPGPVWHPLRDLPHLRPGRVPLPGRGEARPPSLCELSGAGRDHRRVLRAAGPRPAGPDRRGRVAGPPGAAPGARRAESPAALGGAAPSAPGPTVTTEDPWSDARSSSVAWSRCCSPTATSSGTHAPRDRRGAHGCRAGGSGGRGPGPAPPPEPAPGAPRDAGGGRPPDAGPEAPV